MEQQNNFGFNVFVDEDTGDALNIMFNMFREYDWQRQMDEEGSDRNGLTDEHYKKIKRAVLGLVKRVSQESHLRGWCKDPNCNWKDNTDYEDEDDFFKN